MIVREGRSALDQYWSYPVADPARRRTRATRAKIQRPRFSDRARRIRSHQAHEPTSPWGVLSGGLDSSLIVAMMARHTSGPACQTFAVGFRGEGAKSTSWPTRAASRAGSAPTTTRSDRLDEAPVDLAELTWHMDEPIADVSALGFIALCELAARHVTVALSGQGADELLGGYRKHRAAALADAWSVLPRPLGTLRARGALAQ